MDNQSIPTNNNNLTPGQKGGKEKLLISLIVILTCIVGVLGYMLIKQNQKIDTILVDMGGVETERDQVKEDLESLYDDYADLETTNSSLTDSINNQKELIAEYIEQIEKNKDDKYLIYKLKKETATLRSIMKGYVRTIDSLNQVNIALNQELDETNINLKNVSQERDQLEDKNEALEDQVEKGSILKASAFIIQGIKVTGSGKQKEVKRAKQTNNIKACFVLNENKITKSGNKWIYLRIIGPNDKILENPKGSTLMNSKDGDIPYSAKRQIDYQNQDLDVCIYWDANQKELDKGVYKIEIWNSGYLIGKDDIELK